MLLRSDAVAGEHLSMFGISCCSVAANSVPMSLLLSNLDTASASRCRFSARGTTSEWNSNKSDIQCRIRSLLVFAGLVTRNSSA